jgi:hypothetical protein
MLHDLKFTGDCWVSDYCFPPIELLLTGLWPLQKEVQANLQTFTNTVIKSVKTSRNGITSIEAIQRVPKSGVKCGGYDIRTSEDLQDWYQPTDSNRYTKTVLQFGSPSSIFMDATEWGEVLALSGAPYLQVISFEVLKISGN